MTYGKDGSRLPSIPFLADVGLNACSATEFTKGQASRMFSVFKYYREPYKNSRLEE